MVGKLNAARVRELTATEIGSNIHELAFAGENRKEGYLDQLTPDFDCDTVATAGVGRFMRWMVYSVSEFVYSPDIRNNHIVETVNRTKAAFDSKVKELKNHYHTVQVHLHMRRSGHKVDESLFLTARAALTEWNTAFQADDLRSQFNKANEACREVFKKWKGRSRLDWFRSREYFRYDPQLEEIARMQKLIDLEATINCPMPLQALIKLAQGVAPQDKELETLNTWIEKVNNGGWRVTPSGVHEALLAVRDQLGNSVSVLEQQLKNRGLNLFDKADAEHEQWRSDLHVGKALHVGKKEYVLGARLGEGKQGRDDHLVFEVKGDASRVVVVGPNPAKVGLEVLAAAEQKNLVPSAQLIEMGDRFAVMERLLQPLPEHRWTSRYDKLSSEDEAFAAPVVRVLKELMQMPKTPEIACKELMYSPDGALKSVRGWSAGTRFDFDRIVQVAMEASNYNLTVFRHLLTSSAIAQHTQAKFFRAVVEDTLKPVSVGVDEVAAGSYFNISDANIRQTGKGLREKVLALRTQVMSAMVTEYGVTWSKPKMEEAAGRVILLAYDQTIGAGVAWPQLEAIAKATFEQEYKLKRRS